MNKKKKKKKRKKKKTNGNRSESEILESVEVVKLELLLHGISWFVDETTPDRKIRFLGIDTRDIGVVSVLTTEI